MKVIRSAKPYWIYLIITGKKTIEVGKDFPKSNKWDKTVEMYCSKDKKSFNRIPEADREWMRKYLGKIACSFKCNERLDSFLNNNDGWFIERGCLTQEEIDKYQGDNAVLCGWNISELKVYNEPRELSEYCHPCPKGFNDVSNYRCWREWGNRLSQCKYNDMKNSKCKNQVVLPPQSWFYVEEI